MTAPSAGPVRVVVVTGASSGIGLATARAFAARGEHLMLAARSAERLEAAAQGCRSAGAASVRVVPTDVLDPASIGRLVEATRQAHGRIDVFVHAATVMAYGTIEQVPAEVFDAVVDTALHGTAAVARAVLPVFRSQSKGVLIVVNSLLGAIVAPLMGAYATAKAGQAALIRVLQLETRDVPGVRVCSILPGGVDTPIYYQAANYTGRQARPPIPVDPPEKVAREIVRCADRPRNRVSVGLANPVIILGYRLLPKVYDALVGPLFRIGALTRAEAPSSTGNVFAPVPEAEREHGRWPRRWDPKR